MNVDLPGTESGQPLTGVVLSGGGASGACEVGVLKALLTSGERPLDPRIFAGTSIGSFNASFLLRRLREDPRASLAEVSWLERELGVERLRLLTVHRYHPRDDLAGGASGCSTSNAGTWRA